MQRSLILLPLLLLLACEQTVDGPEWPAHQEKLVVTGFIRFETDSLFAYCRVNRTLPLSERFDDSKAIVNDAEVSIENSGRSVTLERSRGFYPITFDFNYNAVAAPSASDAYLLRVRHAGREARATLTRQSASLAFTETEIAPHPLYPEGRLFLYTIPAPGTGMELECLLETWEANFGGWIETAHFVISSHANRPGGMVEGGVEFWGGSRPGKGRLRYTLTARSRVYTDYINARWSWNNYGESPFDPPGKNPPFNVTGDGIGFFWWEEQGGRVEIEY